jgi:steroid delta-isomerase-like uncharacterized protein
VTDVQSFKAWVQGMWAAFPDLQVELTAEIAEDDMVVHVWRTSGTQTGPYMGIPATGQRIEYAGLSANVFSGGKIKSTQWGYNPMLVLQQLGVLQTA